MSDVNGFDPGTPGASARRKHERHRARRERRMAERHPRIGRLVLALQEPPPYERQWAVGAEGEEMLAASLARRCPDVAFLHDRRMPSSAGNIDHLAIAASGVWVIDTKRYTGKVEVRRPLFGEPRLMIAGRDRTPLVEGLERQVRAIDAALRRIAAGTPIHGCLCFVAPRGAIADSGLPLVRTLSIDGFPLLYPRRLAARLRRPGAIAPGERRSIAAALAVRFPPA